MTGTSTTITLYAEYANAPCVITYVGGADSDYGSGLTEEDATVLSSYNQTINLKTSMFIKENYEFNGWSKNPDGSGIKYLAGDNYIVYTDTVFYAVWKGRAVLISFDVNKSYVAGSITPVSMRFGDSLMFPKGDGTDGYNALTHVNYTFAGFTNEMNKDKPWSEIAPEYKYTFADTYEVTPATGVNNIIFYAVWIPKNYDVAFMDGGLPLVTTPTLSAISVPYDSIYSIEVTTSGGIKIILNGNTLNPYNVMGRPDSELVSLSILCKGSTEIYTVNSGPHGIRILGDAVITLNWQVLEYSVVIDLSSIQNLEDILVNGAALTSEQISSEKIITLSQKGAYRLPEITLKPAATYMQLIKEGDNPVSPVYAYAGFSYDSVNYIDGGYINIAGVTAPILINWMATGIAIVDFDLNGGAFNALDSGYTPNIINDQFALPHAAIRNNYTFMGWQNTFTQVTYGALDVAPAALGAVSTYKAIWEGVTKTVTFNTNGGGYSGAAVNPIVSKFGAIVSLPASASFVRTGYDFAGFSETQYNTLWEWNNGAYSSVLSGYIADGDSLRTLLVNNSGLFTGIYTQDAGLISAWLLSSGNAIFDASTQKDYLITSAVTLYAIWVPKVVTIRIEGNGAQLDSVPPAGGEDYSVNAVANDTYIEYTTYYKNGVIFTLLTNPFTKGMHHSFIGFTVTQNGTDSITQITSSNLAGATSITIYCKWQAAAVNVYYIDTSFGLNTEVVDTSAGLGEAYTIKKFNDTLFISGGSNIFELARNNVKFTFYGFEYNGIKYNEAAINTGVQIIPNEDAIFIYVIWNEVNITITYNANNGNITEEADPKTDTRLYNTEYTIIANLYTAPSTMYNGIFRYWSTKSNDGEGSLHFYPGSKITLSNDIVLYAIYAETLVTITYDFNGGYVQVIGDESYEYKVSKDYFEAANTSHEITDILPMYSGFVLAGWVTAEDFEYLKNNSYLNSYLLELNTYRALAYKTSIILAALQAQIAAEQALGHDVSELISQLNILQSNLDTYNLRAILNYEEFARNAILSFDQQKSDFTLYHSGDTISNFLTNVVLYALWIPKTINIHVTLPLGYTYDGLTEFSYEVYAGSYALTEEITRGFYQVSEVLDGLQYSFYLNGNIPAIMIMLEEDIYFDIVIDTAIIRTLYLDGNGGTSSGLKAIIVTGEQGTQLKLTEFKFIKAGYVLAGWSLNGVTIDYALDVFYTFGWGSETLRAIWIGL